MTTADANHKNPRTMIREIDFNCCDMTGGRSDAVPRRAKRADIKAAAQEAYDRLWYVRHVFLGRPAAGEKAALELEAKYGPASLPICDACELRIEGKLGALRWVLYGTSIDNHDT